ncbi:hypothetical protein QBC43DRAFT_337687 [Cladorrhinum sp. PSN259]|nr:hypothetical protein QBC43DRAFT_337687 [Cladorrhinum sp. PSN259]
MKSGSVEEQEPSRIASITVRTDIDNSSTWSLVSPSQRSLPQPSFGVRRRSPNFFSALKALASTNVALPGEHVVAEQRTEVSEKGSSTKSIISKGFRKMSSALFRAAMEPTVIHRTNIKGRPPLQIQQTFSQPPNDILSFSSPPTSARSIDTATNSTATSSSPRNSNSAKTTPKNSTGQTSMDSTLKDNTKDASNPNSNNTGRGGGSSPEKRAHPSHRNHHHNAVSITSHILGRHHRDHHPNHDETRDNSPDSMLTTIQETPLDQFSPSILTVERAAAAKINLETYYQELLCSGPSAREIRSQLLEAHLLSLARQRRHSNLVNEAEMQAVKARFYRRETEYLREMRVLKTKSMRALRETKKSAMAMNDYEEVRILGKGSFGVVKLVREKDKRGQVYAMKCIRKADMLRTQQEGHLKAERDFLIASEGSGWIIQLVASFQDVRNLYLVTEYMPGGDFLGFLIRENVLEESVARFYIAEMILCVEATHSLKFIHRDIKPDNFLISGSGHLKISDFGLAFDGGWLHDMAYYHSHRYSLVNKLGIVVEGDEKDRSDMRSMRETMKWTSNVMTGIKKHQSMKEGDQVLNWRNRCGNRAAARSVIGTSQYMAPEVVLGNNYDARCDYWSVAVILYECLYGQTPFYSEEGRNLTKRNILDHKERFRLPARGGPGGVQNVSNRCKDLMVNLITEKENRLCSKRYKMKDLLMANGAASGNGGSMSAAAMCSGASTSTLPNLVAGGSSNPSSSTARISRDFAGRYVFPYDAEDIKAHKWFRSVPWERLHQMTPPHVPRLQSCDDTVYFKDESVSDWSDTEPSEEEGMDSEVLVNVTGDVKIQPATPPGLVYDNDQFQSPGLDLPQTPDINQYQAGMSFRGRDGMGHDTYPPLPNMGLPTFQPVPIGQWPRSLEHAQKLALAPLRESYKQWALAAVSIPIDECRMEELGKQIKCMPGLTRVEREYLKAFVWQFREPTKLYDDQGKTIMIEGGAPAEPTIKKKKVKRPRDKILRDKKMAKIAMEERRRTAFGGYEWKRIRDEDDEEEEDEGGNELCGGDGGECSGKSRYDVEQGQRDGEIGGLVPGWDGMGLDGQYGEFPE